MKTSDSRRAAVLILALAAGIILESTGREQNAPVSIEDFLKGLGYYSVSLSRDRGNHLNVRAEVAGKGYTFAVDTGCPITRVAPRIARKLRRLGKGQLEDALIGSITNRNVLLLDVKLGAALFTNQLALRANLELAGDSSLDGILGYDFLSRNFCLIDCLDQRLLSKASRGRKSRQPWRRPCSPVVSLK